MSNACPWNDLDDAMVTLLDATLGDAGDYTTLVTQSVAAVAVRDSSDWGRYALDNALPAVFVQNRIIPFSPGSHGDGNQHLDEALEYILLGMATGTQTTARQNAKTLGWRIVQALVAARGVSIIVDSVSRDFMFEPTTCEIGIVNKRDAGDDSFFGWCAVVVRLHGSF